MTARVLQYVRTTCVTARDHVCSFLPESAHVINVRGVHENNVRSVLNECVHENSVSAVLNECVYENNVRSVLNECVYENSVSGVLNECVYCTRIALAAY